MSKVGFLTDSGSDIEQFQELFDSLDLRIIYLYVNIGEDKYSDDTLSLDELLVKMEAADKHNWPKTSQPSAGDFLEHYEKFKEDGYTDVISIHVASKMSGTVNSARLASEEIEDLNVHIIDSQLASSGIIPSILKAKQLLDEGMAPAEVATKVNEWATNVEVFACVPKLDNLYKGGRLKPIRYRLGKLLKFKPVLRLANGEIISHDKTRKLEDTQELGYKEAIKSYSKDDDFKLLISHAWAPDTAERYAKRFKDEFPDKEVHVGRVGPSMAVHLGPEGLVFGAFSLKD